MKIRTSITSETENINPGKSPFTIVLICGFMIVAMLINSEIVHANDQPLADFRQDVSSLIEQWKQTPADSPEEEAIEEAIRALYIEYFGNQTIEVFTDFMLAESGSEQERVKGEELEMELSGIEDPRVEVMEMLRIYAALDNRINGAPDSSFPSTSYDEIGSLEPLDKIDVDIELIVTRGSPVVGELWNVIGVLHNRSSAPVWIVDARTTLSIPPEVWGLTTRGGSIAAFFPSSKSRAENQIIRIEAGRKYTVVWKVDSWRSHMISSREADVGRWRQILSRINFAIRDFLFFQPGTYIIGANVHVWPTLPTLTRGTVSNPGDSITLSTTKSIFVESSQWVLVIGAILGGLLCYVLLLLCHVPCIINQSLSSTGVYGFVADCDLRLSDSIAA